MCCQQCLSGGSRGGDSDGNGDDSSGGNGDLRGCRAKRVQAGTWAKGVDAPATVLLASQHVAAPGFALSAVQICPRPEFLAWHDVCG